MRYLPLFLLLVLACSKAPAPQPAVEPPTTVDLPIALDASEWPAWAATGYPVFDTTGTAIPDMLAFLRDKGVTHIRLRLWHSPTNPTHGLEEVAQFATAIRSAGLQVWLTVHYSDTWADPGQQTPPAAWQGLSIEPLVDSVAQYTTEVAQRIQPDIMQVGNEINQGFLWPLGERDEPANFNRLLQTGCSAIRSASPGTKIMLHFAGWQGAQFFFNHRAFIDYDLIGLSYYPWWHGDDLDNMRIALRELQSVGKPIWIAETAYPFTLDWQDTTHNAIGLADQLHPDYPATPAGQAAFWQRLLTLSANEDLAGIAYWGGLKLAAQPGQTAPGSGWENLAWFDFNHRALPILDVLQTPE